VVGLALTWAVASTAAAVARRRRIAAGVTPLDHDLEVAGRPPAVRLVVLGDSAAAGHGIGSADDALARQLGRALAGRDGRAVVVTSLAVDGATTPDVCDRQVPAMDPEVDAVVVGVGVNDALRPGRLRPDATRALLAALAHHAPGASVVMVGCPDLGVAPGVPPLLRGLVGRRCRTVARHQQRVAAELGVPFVGLDRSVLAPADFGADGFHPGAAGIGRLARLVVERLTGTVTPRR
jgi:lysophospholipase L1-like esterase